jgi:hypothetical protein
MAYVVCSRKKLLTFIPNPTVPLSHADDDDNASAIIWGEHRRKMQIEPLCVNYGATVVQSLVDQIDPTVLNIGTLKVILTGTADEKIIQTNSILEFEDTLLRGTSVSMAAILPMVHYQAVPFHQQLFSIGINPDEQDELDNAPDPDNFRNPDGSFPDLTKYEMQAL